ncbi:MAG TPA: thioredoxin family protein [Thermotogota bacterium]|jgi:small redox-active disulfide protein 2|nr:TM0996/MTH895 family glutaredoxin-like protein [Thermotogota bacterium]NLZ14535.1 thioredoxin family protein [Thermotogaceae bacterium]HNR64428.1 thioredoxin family protein [Thermotogota bacterium]HNT96360.1 thioredoxin family protein [Thermotogota bacterium]HOZ12876.1 thioredoxin family protein [Thermotogota bacterium]
MKIEILGKGCPNCVQLEKNVNLALKNAGLEAEVKKITDLNEIMDYGVAMTPGLVINGKVVSVGKVLKPEQIEPLLKAGGTK